MLASDTPDRRPAQLAGTASVSIATCRPPLWRGSWSERPSWEQSQVTGGRGNAEPAGQRAAQNGQALLPVGHYGPKTQNADTVIRTAAAPFFVVMPGAAAALSGLGLRHARPRPSRHGPAPRGAGAARATKAAAQHGPSQAATPASRARNKTALLAARGTAPPRRARMTRYTQLLTQCFRQGKPPRSAAARACAGSARLRSVIGSWLPMSGDRVVARRSVERREKGREMV